MSAGGFLLYWACLAHAVPIPFADRAVQLTAREQPVAMNCTLIGYSMPKDKLTREVAPLLLEAVHQIEIAYGVRATN